MCVGQLGFFESLLIVLANCSPLFLVVVGLIVFLVLDFIKKMQRPLDNSQA